MEIQQYIQRSQECERLLGTGVKVISSKQPTKLVRRVYADANFGVEIDRMKPISHFVIDQYAAAVNSRSMKQ